MTYVVQPCVGLMGRLFGHKFVKAGWTNPACTCFRCGVRDEQ